MPGAYVFLLCSILLATSSAFESDIVIYGSTPAAISAAVQAKRMGKTAIVVSAAMGSPRMENC